MNNFATNTILPTDNIGDSLSGINTNFVNLNSSLCNIYTFLNQLSSAFSTRAVGITSLDHSIYYSARFTESYPLGVSDANIQFNHLYGGTAGYPTFVYRNLNNVEYNCDTKGNITSSPNAFYTLNTTGLLSGTVTVQPGVYKIDSESSGQWTDGHIANIISVDSNGNEIATLLVGTSEYSNLLSFPTATTYTKCHGRLTFSTPTTIRIKHYIQTMSSSQTALGWSFSHCGNFPSTAEAASVPNLYWSFINIQKLVDYTP